MNILIFTEAGITASISDDRIIVNFLIMIMTILL